MVEDLVEEADDIEETQPEPVDSLRDTLDKAVVEVREKAEKTRDETGKFAKETLKLPKEAALETVPAVIEPPVIKEIAAPASWKSEHKQKWSTIDPELQQEILRREDEVHKGFTRLDEERQLGKQIKDVVTPYLATIQAEGGTPVTAVQSLLNTAHILRTADPYTKANHVMQVIKQFNVDLGLLNGHQQIENQLQEQMRLQKQKEDDTVAAEIQSFASKPEHKYFEQVKPEMQKLLAAGVVPTLEEAYQAAVLANPTVRQLYLAEQSTGVDSKRTQELVAKKKAAVSVSGSSSKSIANAENPNRSLREELEAQFRKSSLD